MDLKGFVASNVAELDQCWAECGTLFRADPAKMIEIWTVLSDRDMQPVRRLSDQDLQIVAALAMLALKQLTHQAAEIMAEAAEE